MLGRIFLSTSSHIKLNSKIKGHHYGVVVASKDNIAQIYGLQLATSGEMVISNKGFTGLVLNLGTHLTGIIAFIDNSFELGHWVLRLFNTLSTKINPFILGNVFDSLGFLQNKDNRLGAIFLEKYITEYGIMIRDVEIKAPGIIVRQPVYESMFTGFMGIDGLLPLGQGQRELIIGDRQTGKTAVAIDIALNQANIDQVFLKNIYT